VDHETGGTSKRQQFQRMFADARARKFDLLLFWSLDRFSREGVSATLNHLERLTAAGVYWRSFTEEYLDSCGFRSALGSILAITSWTCLRALELSWTELNWHLAGSTPVSATMFS
jgi:DNA invertase Pin-like site-specific DNA recombinase